MRRGRALLSLSSRSLLPPPFCAQRRKFDRGANIPRFMGSRRLARAFTAANRNYSSRKNTRIRGASRDSLAFGKGLFQVSRVAAFLPLALKRSNRFSRLFARLKAPALPSLACISRGRCACLLVYKMLSRSPVSICEDSIDVLPFTATSNSRVFR